MSDIIKRLEAGVRSGRGVDDETAELARDEIDRLTAERAELIDALHDAIRRPLGVVPASASRWYSHDAMNEADQRRTKGGVER